MFSFLAAVSTTGLCGWSSSRAVVNERMGSGVRMPFVRIGEILKDVHGTISAEKKINGNRTYHFWSVSGK